MADDLPRSRAARVAAERALIRIVHHYGARPEFVVLGGLVPELLCSSNAFNHAGTTDIDVQVDLEIACGAVNTSRLEKALRNAEFEPDHESIWRWKADGVDARTIVKFELFADLDDEPASVNVAFDGCDYLGALNLRGTSFASRDIEIHTLRARVGGIEQTVEINVTGLAGFLLAKAAAARSRRKPKDWYDIAFVLLHNNAGGPEQAAQAVLTHFAGDLVTVQIVLDDLLGNFATPNAQGPAAYAEQMMLDHPDLEHSSLLAEAVIAVETFHELLYPRGDSLR